MQEEQEPLSLADATYEVLQQGGIEALLNAEAFKSALLDCANGGAAEVRMLRRNLDGMVLEPLSFLVRGDGGFDQQGLGDAVARFAYLLEHERFVAPDLADKAAYQLSEGICRYLGIGNFVQDPDATGEIPLIPQDPVPGYGSDADFVRDSGEPDDSDSTPDSKDQSSEEPPEDPYPDELLEAPTPKSQDAKKKRSTPPTPSAASRSRRPLHTAVAIAIIALLSGAAFFLSQRVSVTFDGNGATSGSTKAVSTLKGHELTLPDSGYELEGYSFAGWSKTADGKVAYQPQDTLEPTEATTLYAQWLPHIAFEGNNADSGEVESQLVPESGIVTLPDNTYERTGYRFGGWSLSENGVDAQQPTTEVKITEPTTYYAAWQPIASFEGNGADEGQTKDVAASVDGELVMPKSAFKKAGYRFGGWSLTKDGADERLAAKEQTTIDAPTTYYATWDALASFASRGTVEGQTKAVAENDKGQATLPECGFRRADCVFIGWYEDDGTFEKNPYYVVKDLHQPGEKTTLGGQPKKFYACWKFDDATLEKLHVDKIERSGNDGKTVLLLIRNDSTHRMEINGQIRFSDASGKQVNTADIFSPAVEPGETVLQTCSGNGDGSFDYSLLGRPSRFSTESTYQRIKTEEVSVAKGKVTLKVTNTSEKTLHLLNAQAYATQSGMETTGGFAYSGGEGYEKTLKPGASTTVTFGSDDWDAPWPDLVRNYYFDGYAK